MFGSVSGRLLKNPGWIYSAVPFSLASEREDSGTKSHIPICIRMNTEHTFFCLRFYPRNYQGLITASLNYVASPSALNNSTCFS